MSDKKTWTVEDFVSHMDIIEYFGVKSNIITGIIVSGIVIGSMITLCICLVCCAATGQNAIDPEQSGMFDEQADNDVEMQDVSMQFIDVEAGEEEIETLTTSF